MSHVLPQQSCESAETGACAHTYAGNHSRKLSAAQSAAKRRESRLAIDRLDRLTADRAACNGCHVIRKGSARRLLLELKALDVRRKLCRVLSLSGSANLRQRLKVSLTKLASRRSLSDGRLLRPKRYRRKRLP